MARGYPDFFGTSVFPMYGNNGLAPNGPADVDPAATVTIFDIGGKFVCQGGFLDMWDDDGAGATQVDLYIDGVHFFGQSIANMFQHQGAGPLIFPFYLMRYAPGDERYVIGFSGPYTVGTGWRMDLISVSTVNIALYGRFWYSTVVDL